MSGGHAGLAGAALGGMLCLNAGVAMAADSVPGMRADAPGIEIAREGGPARLVAASELATLPAVQVTVRSELGHGPSQRTFSGPLLWTVLERGGLVEGLGARDQARAAVVVTGRDDYVAVIALGEISPEFEAKQVIIAENVDGQPIPPENLRIVVPGDKRGARNVHEIGWIKLLAALAGTH